MEERHIIAPTHDSVGKFQPCSCDQIFLGPTNEALRYGSNDAIENWSRLLLTKHT
jgi:hypothetical protein